MLNNKKKYILYGASFDPPHMGHFSAIRQLLEEFDKVIIFPYPHKHDTGQIQKILPISKRLEMLSLFISEFFPLMTERLIIVDLAKELSIKDKKNEGFLHTYDYLKYVEQKIDKDTTDLSICLGIDAQNSIKKNNFFKEDEIKSEFNIFYLTEEKNIKSKDIRDFLNGFKVKSKKDEQEVVKKLGFSVSQYILKNSLYGSCAIKPKTKEKTINKLKF